MIAMLDPFENFSNTLGCLTNVARCELQDRLSRLMTKSMQTSESQLSSHEATEVFSQMLHANSKAAVINYYDFYSLGDIIMINLSVIIMNTITYHHLF